MSAYTGWFFFQVKALPGLGTTIDVVLVNGRLCEGATMILAGTEGPIVTPIRGLLMPQPMKELRVKVSFKCSGERILDYDWSRYFLTVGAELIIAKGSEFLFLKKDREILQLFIGIAISVHA